MTTNANPDDCILIEHSLALWVGGDLEREVHARVNRHLAQCASCSAAARSLERTREALLAGWSQSSSSAPDLWPGVRDALRREGILAGAPLEISLIPSAVPAARTSVKNRPRVLRFASVAAAAAAAVLVGFLLGRLGGHVAEPQAPPIASAPSRGSVIVAEPSDAARSAHLVVPVSDGVHLRPLAPSEARLSDSVENLGSEWFINPGSFGNPNAGSPASLQSAYPRRW